MRGCQRFKLYLYSENGMAQPQLYRFHNSVVVAMLISLRVRSCEEHPA